MDQALNTSPTESVTAPHLFQLAEMSNEEAYEAISAFIEDRRTLREELQESTLNEVDRRLSELGETREQNTEMIAQYTDDVENLARTFDQIDGRRLFNETLDEIRLRIRSEVALETIRSNASNRLARLQYLITSNALVVGLISKLPADQQERINRAVIAESENLDQVVDEALSSFGVTSDTLLLVGAQHDANDPRFSGVLQAIQHLPMGESISTVLNLTRSAELVDFYRLAADEMEIDATTFAELQGMTIGEVIALTSNVNTFDLDAEDPNDKIIFDYMKIADLAQNTDLAGRLHNSFVYQVENDDTITHQEKQQILSEVSYENLSIDALVAFIFGNDEFQRNWYQYLAGATFYANRLRRLIFDSDYVMHRHRVFGTMRNFMRNSSYEYTEQRRQRLVGFGDDITESYDELRSSLTQSEARLKEIFNDPAFQNPDGSFNVRALNERYYEMLSEHNTAVRRWNKSINETAERLIADERRLAEIHQRLTAPGVDIDEAVAAMSNDDWNFLKNNFEETLNKASLANLDSTTTRHTFVQNWRHGEIGMQIGADQVSRTATFKAEVEKIGGSINNQTRTLNNLGVIITDSRGIDTLQRFQAENTDTDTRINPDDLANRVQNDNRQAITIEQIRRDTSDVKNLLTSQGAATRAQIRRAAPVAIYGGLAIAPNVAAVVRGDSNMESALIHTAQTGLYFIPIVGSLASIGELATLKTISGEKIRGAGQIVSHAGFTALGIVSDVLWFTGLGAPAAASIRASTAAAQTARATVAITRATGGSVALASAARGVDAVADVTNASRRTVELAENTSQIARNSDRIKQSDEYLKQTRQSWFLEATDSAGSTTRRFAPWANATEGASSARTSLSRFISNPQEANRFRQGLDVVFSAANLTFQASAVPFRFSSQVLRTGLKGVHQLSENLFLKGRDIFLNAGNSALKLGRLHGDQNIIRALESGKSTSEIIKNLPEGQNVFNVLSSQAARLQAEMPTTFRNFSNYINNSRLGDNLRRFEAFGGMAALGTMGVAMLSSGSVNPIDLAGDSFEIASSGFSTGYDATRDAIGWLRSDHQTTDYEQIVRGITSSTLDYIAYNESRDPNDLEGYIDAGIDDPTVQHIARMNGVDLNQLIETQNSGLGGLTEAIGGDSGGSQELTA